MKKTILTMASMAALSLLGTAFAQSFDDYSSDEESAEPTLVINGETGANVRGWIGEYGENGWKTISNVKDADKTTMDAGAYAKLDISYEADSTDANVKLKFDSATIKEYTEDILEEATIRGFFGNWVISAGKMKTVWGKGDKLHVVDNFNANDYTDFVFPDYIDRRIAEPMISLAYNVPNESNLHFEGTFTPFMTADRLAADGILMPAAQRKLTGIVESIMANNLAHAVAGVTDGGPSVTPEEAVASIMGASSFTSDMLFEDNLRSLKYAQAGARVTGTLGSLDWGFSYYYGHYKQPSANLENYIKSMIDAAITDHETEIPTYIGMGLSPEEAAAAVLMAHADEYILSTSGNHIFALPSLAYDQVQTFGFEAATVLWKFNTRAEVAYNLTEDTDGTNPWVKNNSIGWIAGFDMDLPIHNLNINIQEQGSYILNSDKIKEGMFAAYDVDYKTDDKYCRNKLVINISDKWMNEKLTTECTTIYGIEAKEWCVQPKIEYNPADGLFLTVSGGYICSDKEDGEFYNFTADSTNNKKGFAEVSIRYNF